MKHAPKAKLRPRPAWVGQRDVVVCRGGALDGRWYFADDFAAAQEAARRMGHGPTHPASRALGYQPVTGTEINPELDGVHGTVLAWRPTP